MTGAIVLLNPQAGAGRAAALRPPIQRWLEHFAPAVPLLAPDNVEAALATLTITAKRTRVVLVGGDGTLQSLLPALLQRRHRIGLVPAGCCNDLAEALGLTRLDWSRALHYALHAPTAPIDLGRVESEEFDGLKLFCATLGCGEAALLDRRMRSAPDLDHMRQLRALWQRLRGSFADAPHELNLWADGRAVHSGPAHALSVLNTPLGHLAQDGDPQALSWRLTTGRLPERLRAWRAGDTTADAPPHCSRKLLVSCREPIALMLDGEPQPPLQCFTLQLQSRALHVAHCSD